ncbi:LD-carboxypeptidase [Paenibacillus sp. J31TS4]|uniref:S66 family peptidase n=1 Tax=Paenibacillus sp. J31TS4 TaxID=2807195 RepID=UPI001B078AC8|nr:S66 peptidase family protein [Paenibacillus sp. J31TS4]GIP39447.1 LD-carboxypeptidase [Paenibacillus sp. J31TS4]
MSHSIRYPQPLKRGDRLAVTAPSSGVDHTLHPLLDEAKSRMEGLGFAVVEGEALRSNVKCVSASKETRAEELQRLLTDDEIRAVIPPWGGEFLMELLPLLDWERLRQSPPKWIHGYSDISTLTFAYTLATGYASSHGPNYIDLRAPEWDPVTARWLDVLGTPAGGSVRQRSSALYQAEWNFAKPGFQLDTPTTWTVLGHEGDAAHTERASGRLLGGCLDTISRLAGTPYAPVEAFVRQTCADTGVLWYLESCEMNAAELYRSLWQLRQCGWFAGAAGVLFGRPAGYSPTKDFELTDALEAVFGDLNIPVVYGADIGHVPPQLTLVNGAMAELKAEQGGGELTMTFR